MSERDEADKRAMAASERKRREREGDEALTDGARVSARGSRARSWPPGPGREEGSAGARGWLGRNSAQPREGGVFVFLFLILIPFFSFFYFCFFLFLFPLRPKYFLSDLE
jgi:hypothetical protein